MAIPTTETVLLAPQAHLAANLDAAFFPVELRPVGMSTGVGKDSWKPLDHHRVVVDTQRQRAFAVVTRDYELITNRAAVEMAQVLMHRVFKATTMTDMACFNLVMPKTRSFCHIDLVHKSAVFEPWEHDRWSAFLRITNSYNRTRRLRFEIGFCRWICRNGIIFGRHSIEFSYSHSRPALEKVNRLAQSLGHIHDLEQNMINHLQALRSLPMRSGDMLALACKVFEVRWRDNLSLSPRRVEEVKAFRDQIVGSATAYFEEMGSNAYAALNVLTDYASRPSGVISPEARLHGLQRRAGQWADSFIEDARLNEFNMDDYLGLSVETARRLSSI